ncbi:MAG: UDP-N-acetylmuramoyl-tripeptide--D-alanyl-D-alanine ligase [Tepidibacter sp.]|jgi:UDP-N-acetylmuramoyl-tripeptide--D-alanyl-D-alanine ligase|uniref:UDP-N-acetylmuramoyl-tripeptide--D-alanyl-D- alanine ligase n=1 Tax=Tepidibacter sp. TaxID=2529387 RepID=UPI0025D240DB|nr:UDP-N-acetylmuramoyl-tripeptide--D-alanyl-D-alanine ligase [Tepidibacter sp.]MCT4508540.1 UDP-N-acetylmuramoyl-tripeptide--D-alanyl-D-alanine ligase [Tepidibacter sp.]
MKAITINDILNNLNATLIKGSKDTLIESISINSKNIENKCIFIPLIGEKFDAHDFVIDAYENGCRIFLKDKNHDLSFDSEDVSIIEVEDTTKALGDIARLYKEKFLINYVAVTGSTGKTTTKDMIYNVLSSKYNTLKTEGNFNNHIGLPLTVFKLKDEHECAILEMGMSSFGEIEYLSSIVNHKIAVISNIGLSHIQNLGSREGILKAKLEITKNFTKDNTLIINADDDYLKTLKDKKLNYNLKTFGFEKDNDLYCTQYKMNETGIDFECIVHNQKEAFFIPARGKHNIYNAMAAILTGTELGLNIDQIKKGLLNFKNTKMRLDILKTDLFEIINDAYNASPDSMKAAINILGEYKKSRKIAILGDMLEMGEYAKNGHEIVGEYANSNADLIITVGKDSRHIGNGAIKKGFDRQNIVHFDSNSQVIDYLRSILKKDDTILIKGSRGMKMEEIVKFLNDYKI